MTRAPELHLLAVVQDPTLARILEIVAREEGDLLRTATTVEGALDLARAHRPDVAFVELAVEGGAALALCHHLPALAPTTELHAVVSTEGLAQGGEALSLGAAGVIVGPVTGDAVARVLSAVKERAVRAEAATALERRVATARRRVEVYDRLVRFARGAAPSEAVRAIVEGVAQLSGAEGVALFATFGDEKSDRVRLAAIGAAVDLPSTSPPADLARLVALRAAKVVPLVAAQAELGILVLQGMPSSAEGEVASLADLAAAMLSFIDRHDRDDARRGGPDSFLELAERLLGIAGRHGRRGSVLAIALGDGDAARARRDAVVAEIGESVRSTDALSGNDEGDLLLFLPETGALGAHACRRRIAARLSGDRRARPRGSAARAAAPRSLASPVCIGVATFPHDGTTLRRLVRAARTRAADDARSAVHGLSLEGLALHEIVDTLLARPMVDAGPRSPLPLDVPSSALFALVARACEEARRGGAVSVTATLQPGLGVAAAARTASSPRVLDVRGLPSCEDVEVVVVEAEHAAWVCCGRLRGERFHGVHAADPLLADVLVRRLSAAGGPHAG